MTHKIETASRSDNPQLLYTEEVAEMLRVPVETLRYWKWQHRGPKSFKLPGGRRVLYALEDVEAFIAEARQGVGAA